MKCEIALFGILKIYPQNETEFYACQNYQLNNVVNMEDHKLMESHFYRGSKIEIIHPSNNDKLGE